MKSLVNPILLYWVLLLFFAPNEIQAISPSITVTPKLEKLSNYNSLNECTYLSPADYTHQIARFTIDKPGFIKKKIIVHLDGPGVGKFTCHIYGHESGTNYPALAKDLIRPITKKKRKKGAQSIVIKLRKPVLVTNDQFYISLDNFTGEFGLKQDSTFYKEFCCSVDGADYYPTLLRTHSKNWALDNCYTTMDVLMEFAPIPPPIFKEITQEVDINLQHSNEHIAWGDMDGDNWVDLLLDGRIYKNDKGKFRNITNTVSKNIPQVVRGAAFIDMDNDGDQDILFMGTNNSLLYLNEGKDSFTTKEIALPPLPSLHAFSIADINEDKLPDLMVAQLWNPYPLPHPNFLFLNDGQNNFKDITKRLYPQHDGKNNFPDGLDCIPGTEKNCLPSLNKNRRSRGTQFTDFDLDGDLDLYITNYFLEKDEFYQNDGNGFFRAISPPKPFGQSEKTDNHGTGVDWYDFDNDGDFDLLLPQLAHPRYLHFDHRGTTIFRNDNGQFTDLNPIHGIEYEETHAGASFGDINNDGLADIVTTVYYGCRFIDFYLQKPDHSFELSTYQSGLSKHTTGNDACFVDFNNDGLLDLAMGEKGKFRLYENIKNNGNSWIKIQLRSSTINHFGIGAKVKIHLKNGEILTQEVNVGRGQRMQKPTTLHFGLGKVKNIEKVTVQWAKETIGEFYDFQINQAYLLEESGKKYLLD